MIAGIWAHYDDDLLFAVPTIDEAILAGHGVRQLFLTASDAGSGMSPYVDARETGIRAAYDVMRGSATAWSDRRTVLSNGVAVTTTSPDDDPRISLSFLRLPDGGLTGGGWYATGYRTITKLLRGEVSSLTTLDTGQDLTVAKLITTIAAFVADAGATAVLTIVPDFAEASEGDHPDHSGAGRLVAAAVDTGLLDGSIVRYAVGYPGHTWPANLDDGAVARKLAVFAAYGAHDAVLRRDTEAYLALPGVRDWLRREHLIDDHDIVRASEPHSDPSGGDGAAARHATVAGDA
ncbi:LmbE family N-acetylglucosaminyl deacetylase [Microbacterium proteolyticum]|uniref:LmbE family N-acetylglucosaminyl deacetylase n=1 Tax=Microbacterium proteolyticum TaxID=1572644 RepID=A0A7W5CKE7_9MICO|nr:PIG-L family deacetylase [Microbacterium proteolyticum]MBB3159318.1 LmbE family N-acetylglucosaminyl deacetylase [Microbacterium proteolyticum]